MGDVGPLTTEGPAWPVLGTNGENAVSAQGRTQAEAWHRAGEQAEAAGMLTGLTGPTWVVRASGT